MRFLEMTKLTENLVFDRTKSSVESVVRLNLWGCDIEDISLCSRMPNLKILALSVNNVQHLEALMHCSELEELYVRKNNIEDISEIEFLRPLKKLRTLWLDENPVVSATENYRLRVIAVLPQLKMLDNRPVTKDELHDAAALRRKTSASSHRRHSKVDSDASDNDDRHSTSTGHNTNGTVTPPPRARRQSYTDLPDEARLMGEPIPIASQIPMHAGAYNTLPANFSAMRNSPPAAPMIIDPGSSMAASMYKQQQQQQILHHQNAINELMSASYYQPPVSHSGTPGGGASGGVPQSMTMSLMRPSFAPNTSLSPNMAQQHQQGASGSGYQSDAEGTHVDVNTSWPEFGFEDPPSVVVTARQDECGSPVAPLTAPSTFITQREIQTRKRHNRSRSISPSRNSANIIVAITNLLDELDPSGLRAVIDEAQRRMKKQR